MTENEARTRWNTRHAARARHPDAARFLTAREDLLPRSGRALDVAGGTGRNAVRLARRGLRTTLVDVSDEACRQAREAAAAVGVALEVVRADVTTDGLPAGPWDVVLCHHFLDLAVWRSGAQALSPGGLLLACQPTVRNLERHERPARRWLLDEGQLAAEVAGWCDVEVIELDEGWTDEGRHEARLVVRRTDPHPSGRDAVQRATLASGTV
ncbi:class I SAM-dependent methyltransferase [Egicoccus sp. AB-alg2]|uniref:class I SAM-dependent methyltransferase n=1 Tax=Egicoccus sp. AB-alg2 TaxID=3242693 RepID=UPI00359D610E